MGQSVRTLQCVNMLTRIGVLLVSSVSLVLSDYTKPAPIRRQDAYGAPSAPAYQDSYSAPSYRAPSYSGPTYSAPSYNTVQSVELPPNDYYKHETHHFYHAGPPRVYQVQVPVTRKPATVHVPQNVPVNFVPVHVPTQDLGPLSVVELDPFADHYGDPYVKRKELVKGALLLGTGMIKGALLTTLYNNLANERSLRAEGKQATSSNTQ